MDHKVCNIAALNINAEALLEELQTAELVTTAVGLAVLPKIAPVIAQGIRRRKTGGITRPLNIIACENAVRASTQLKEAVLRYLSAEETAYVERYVGFPDCSVDRIVPPVRTEKLTDVVVESFFEWNVEEAAFRGSAPRIEGMNLAGDLAPYVERKLFTLNTGHAIAAYLGFLKGFRTVDQSIADPTIHRIVRSAMSESGQGLIKKFGFNESSHAAYIEKTLGRLGNAALNDEVTRVCRDPLRKLSPQDRLVRPLLLAKEHGFGFENLLWGIGAALRYHHPNDRQSVELQQLIREQGLERAAEQITGITDGSMLGAIAGAYGGIMARLR